MIQEAYVSHEVAKLLKEKGFESDECKNYYLNEDITIDYTMLGFGEGSVIQCPTHQMAMAWLREKNIYIVVYPSKKKPYTLYKVDISTKDLSLKEGHLRGVWNTYEEAVEAALKYSLENLS